MISLSYVIKREYRSLCYASGTGMDEFIFGKNLENQLKGIDVTSKQQLKNNKMANQLIFRPIIKLEEVF